MHPWFILVLHSFWKTDLVTWQPIAWHDHLRRSCRQRPVPGRCRRDRISVPICPASQLRQLRSGFAALDHWITGAQQEPSKSPATAEASARPATSCPLEWKWFEVVKKVYTEVWLSSWDWTIHFWEFRVVIFCQILCPSTRAYLLDQILILAGYLVLFCEVLIVVASNRSLPV